jgi:adenine-specific DNA-methyltransferase
MVMEHLKTSGGQQAHRKGRTWFTALKAVHGDLICAKGCDIKGDEDPGGERRAGIFVGTEFDNVSHPDLGWLPQERLPAPTSTC